MSEAIRKILENLLDDYMRLAEQGNRKDLKITIDLALSQILALTNLRPLEEKEVAKIIVDKYADLMLPKEEGYKELEFMINQALMKKYYIDTNKLREIIKYHVEAYGGKINPKDDFAGFIFDLQQECSHFSKPIVYPEKMKHPFQHGCMPKCFMCEKIDTYNSAIDDMLKLNGSGE